MATEPSTVVGPVVLGITAVMGSACWIFLGSNMGDPQARLIVILGNAYMRGGARAAWLLAFLASPKVLASSTRSEWSHTHGATESRRKREHSPKE
jgi:hypothetical protein